MKSIFGRDQEIAQLEQLYLSKRSEFVAVYGRRRVGKTFLVKELFGKKYAFQATGLFNGNTSQQLNNFYKSLNLFFPSTMLDEQPKTWLDAFHQLIQVLEKKPKGRKVIFIDEMPWMDTPRSDFLSAIEHFWNSWAFHRNDVKLIVCGSATSWMITQLINNYGGLHNRVNTRIHLQPFNLHQTEIFLKANSAKYDRYQLLQLYMTMGGVPFYLEQIDLSKSVAQNIDDLFFNESGILRNEFIALYRSLFKKADRHIAVIEALAKKSKGLLRNEIAKNSKIPNGGTLTKTLDELEQCGFIKRYLPFGKKQRGSLYHLIDSYSLFYLKFVRGSKAAGTGSWLSRIDHPSWRSWSGYAFENICFQHIEQIKQALSIAGVYTEVSSWRSAGKNDRGAQIDLVLDRRDRVINLCEIKFSQDVYSINKGYAESLKNKISHFRQETKTTKSLFLTFITTFGLKQNAHAINLVQNELGMDILFDN